MSICIYCKKKQNKSNFSNREHVIPQAFGLFEPINFILNERQNRVKHVCDTCNKQFGGSIDRWLAKDSYEGYILRNKYLKNVKSDNRYRVSVKISDGELKGLNIHFSKNMTITPMAQIGLLNKNNQWEYFLPDEVSKVNKENFKLSEKKSLIAFQMTDEDAMTCPVF